MMDVLDPIIVSLPAWQWFIVLGLLAAADAGHQAESIHDRVYETVMAKAGL